MQRPCLGRAPEDLLGSPELAAIGELDRALVELFQARGVWLVRLHLHLSSTVAAACRAPSSEPFAESARRARTYSRSPSYPSTCPSARWEAKTGLPCGLGKDQIAYVLDAASGRRQQDRSIRAPEPVGVAEHRQPAGLDRCIRSSAGAARESGTKR